MPIDFVLMRASSIPSVVKAEESKTKAGITGSDILWEATLKVDNGEEIPLYQFNPDAKRSSLYIGITKGFADFVRDQKQREPEAVDLTGSMVATKYPRIANGVLRGYGVRTPIILHVDGTDEAMQYAFPSCIGILGIISSGKTRERNDIEILEIFYDVSLRMVTGVEKLNKKDADILNDFREQIAVALQRRRMV